MWDATKAVLRGKSVVLTAYIRKGEKFYVHDLSFYSKKIKIKNISKFKAKEMK